MRRVRVSDKQDNVINKLFEHGTISLIDVHPKLREAHCGKIWNEINTIRLHSLDGFVNLIDKGYVENALALYKGANEIPCLSYLEEYFHDSDWNFVWSNKIKEDDFFYLCSKKIFPITSYCRAPEELDRSIYPDFIHDLWGHVPMLRYPRLFEFLEKISELFIEQEYSDVDIKINELISSQAKLYKKQIVTTVQDDSIDFLSSQGIGVKKMLSRLILFTFEFGVIKAESMEDDRFEIIGGGILSSSRELNNLVKRKKIHRLTINNLLEAEYRLHDQQNFYHCFDSMNYIFNMLEELRLNS